MNEKDRIIFHIDCNGFYASVEEVFHPELKKVPMAVCGNPNNRHGIILAKNELAKTFGVKTAEPIWQAQRKCPQLVLAGARHDIYREYCERINAIYEQYTSRVERFGIDESFLDVTGSLHLFGGDAERLAHEIRRRVPRETGLTVSVGVSFNKIFAKLGSDMKKPNAVTVITRDGFRDTVWPLPVSALLMVGRSTEKALKGMRIHTIGELARANQKALHARFGKMGDMLHIYANGWDNKPVLERGESAPPQSVGNGYTFKRDLVSREDVQTAVTALADSVAARLRRVGMKCRSLQVTIKDTNLKVITRQKPLDTPTFIAGELARAAVELIEVSWKIGVPIRMITVTGQKLVPAEEANEQLSFFIRREEKARRERRERLEMAVDSIRTTYGKRSIDPGSVLRNDLGIHEGYVVKQDKSEPEGEKKRGSS